ncbi:MAG TPA: hypothetical protein VFD58_26125 [Blastocatellia bacterium]|nr:hypothetical protein [Blastocatellia bacterium]
MRSPVFTLTLICILAAATLVRAQSAADGPATTETSRQKSEQELAAARPAAEPQSADPAKKDQEKKDAPAKSAVQSPDDRPLGAAGPSRDDKTEGDGDYRAVADRWRIGFPTDPRYVRGHILNPYRQNILKGDYPIVGQHTFLNLTMESESTLILRRLPLPQDVSSVRPGSYEFFGRGRQEFFNQNFIFSFDLFHGDTSFKPADWRLHITPVVNINFLRTRENGAVNIDPREGKTRLDGFVGFEELSYEMRLGDTSKIFPFLRGRGSVRGRSPSFDTTSVRVGVQSFNSDFRGFIFNDSNLGVRFFGNHASNRYQFNVAYFNMLEKETNSELNTVNFREVQFRDQKVWIANLYRQDTFVKGYTAQLSLHYNSDQASVHYDENRFLVRPAKIGDVAPHHIRVGYLGWAGDGHFGKINVTHAFYQAIGRDERNPIAGRATHINAQMAAGEVSLDRDWLRLRASVFYTSGDSKPTDGTARGFDSILDNVNFSGGRFSFWNSQPIGLTETGVLLVAPHSLIPSLRSSKTEGQANFVNPGITIYNVGFDADITPKLRGFINYNYLHFNRTEPLELVQYQPKIRHDLGHDLGIGFIYRPPLTENVIITGGLSGLKPGNGFTDIYSSNCAGTPQGCGAGRPPLWAAFMTVKFTY